MENKQKKRSIHSVIYLVLAAMLVSIVGISIYTVASRRKPVNPDGESTVLDSHETTRPIETDAPETKPADTKAPDPAVTTPAETTAPVTTADTAASVTPSEVPTSVGLRYFVLPSAGSVSKEFEIDIPVYSMTMNDYRAHTGIDIAASLGSEVVSASSGIICRVWNDPLMGRSVMIDHGDGIYTVYKNLADELAVGMDVGVSVTMGEIIGAVGESALVEIAEEPHLHFEMQVNGVYVDPLDYIEANAGADETYEF
ncbi:MAG: hypothetical protein E7632_03065 [Ruminococcaceae bacterium]|nr:hypothetical protein [Oscillospiraceae bacterium]